MAWLLGSAQPEIPRQRAVDGLVEARLLDALPLMNEALGGSIGSQPPRGASQEGPSTYWIGRALLYLVATAGRWARADCHRDYHEHAACSRRSC